MDGTVKQRKEQRAIGATILWHHPAARRSAGLRKQKEYDFVMMAAFCGCKVRNLISCRNKDGCFEIALEVDLVKEAQA